MSPLTMGKVVKRPRNPTHLDQPISDPQLVGSDVAWNDLCMQTMMLRQQSPALTKPPDNKHYLKERLINMAPPF